MNETSTVSIDARSTGEPISPFIYGQFIEHLGRCIQGGIWAEMLEDRKFHDPVGEGDSPWETVGGACVRMSRDDAFVGDHTPAIELTGGRSAGIAQGGLAVIAGKDYVGRVWLAGDQSVGSAAVSLVWGDGESDRQTVTISPISAEFTKYPLRFTAPVSSDTARLEIVSSGTGTLRVGAVSLMPFDNVDGMRPDTLALLKELDSPVYRWPGGNFVSGYDWRDGIGDRDRRPPRKNPAWRGIEHDDFGIHEFLRFCEELNTEPLIVVNTGFGDSHSAAEEVEYVNGAAHTPMGQLRAANGHPEPWGVKWWGIGNEMFGDWQLGHMKLEQYVHKHNDFERKMRAVDPGIITIGVGEHGKWSEGMMAGCAEHMDYVSEHFYAFKPKDDVAEHAGLVAGLIREKCDAHRRYRKEIPALQGKDIRIAMDEWNYWYGEEPYGELGTRYFMKDALGIAAGLHEYYRNSDIVGMANYAQTVNVIGCIKTTATKAEFEIPGLVLALYRREYGTVPVAVSGVPAPLDAAAALSEDGKRLTVSVVNPTAERFVLAVNVAGAAPGGTGTRYSIASDDPMAYNAPEEARRVDIVETDVTGFTGQVEVEPYGIVLYTLAVQG